MVVVVAIVVNEPKFDESLNRFSGKEERFRQVAEHHSSVPCTLQILACGV